MKKAQKFAQNNATEWKSRGFKTSNAPTTKSEFSEMPDAGNSSAGRFQNTFGSPSRPRPAGAKPFSKFGKPKTPTDHEETASPDDIDPAAEPHMKKKKVKGSEKSGEKSQDKSPQKTGVDKPPKKKKKKTPEGEAATPSEGDNVGEVVTSNNQKRKKQKFQGYTLFIGNLSYDTTVEDIQNHFAKCGTIKNVRLPLEKGTNQPRGFGYIEVEEHVTYEKVLSLHHTFLKRRRINVECTFGGSNTSQKRKALIKEKTLKLRFLSREGKISSAKQRPWGKFTKKAEES